MSWYLEVWKKYAVFSGRSQRSEYWYFTLFSVIIGFVLGFIGGATRMGVLLAWIYIAAAFLPSLAVAIRRLHDTNRSGWWFLIALIPLIGSIVLIVFYVEDSEPGANAYGPNPKAVSRPSGVLPSSI